MIAAYTPSGAKGNAGRDRRGLADVRHILFFGRMAILTETSLAQGQG